MAENVGSESEELEEGVYGSNLSELENYFKQNRESLIGNPKRKRNIQLRIILEDRVLKGDLILKTILR